MKKYILFFLFTTFFLPKVNFGCSCLSPSTFCESITNSNGNIRPEVILRGKFFSNFSGEHKIEVNQLIYGNISQRELTLVYGQYSLFFQNLEDGNEYIFALNLANDRYTLLGCAISFLKIDNGMVSGKITPGIDRMDYGDIIDLKDCGNAFDLISLEKNILLFPNPTDGSIKIRNLSSEISLEHVQFKIFDMIGKELFADMQNVILLPEDNLKIDIEHFPSGVYIIEFSANFTERIFKVVKQ